MSMGRQFQGGQNSLEGGSKGSKKTRKRNYSGLESVLFCMALTRRAKTRLLSLFFFFVCVCVYVGDVGLSASTFQERQQPLIIVSFLPLIFGSITFLHGYFFIFNPKSNPVFDMNILRLKET